MKDDGSDDDAVCALPTQPRLRAAELAALVGGLGAGAGADAASAPLLPGDAEDVPVQLLSSAAQLDALLSGGAGAGFGDGSGEPPRRPLVALMLRHSA